MKVRLHPEALRRLQERAEAAEPGQRGGVAAFIRGLLYREIDFPSSDEWDALEKGGEQAPDGR